MSPVLRLLLILGLGGVLFVGAFRSPVSTRAQQPDGDVEVRVQQIAQDLYCPVCPGVPLDVCQTQACVQWRGLIREKLLAGESEEQIRAYFVSHYGDRVLGLPPFEGFNAGVYLLPALALVAGSIFLFWTMRSWLKQPPPSGTSHPGQTAPLDDSDW
jgi:cytochrome c-type biogenesis protein CcmH